MAETADAPKRKKMDLSVKILLGLLLGVVAGLFFGEYCAFLKPVGDVYVGLLQMTVLPYIMIALIAGIGRLSLGDSKRLMLTGLKALLLLWVIGAVVLLAATFALPSWESGSFFSASDFDPPPERNLLQLFVPYNIFESLAATLVPAVVLFCLVLGVALIGIKNKAVLIDALDVMSEALMRVNKGMVRLAPYGTFAIAAAAAGTMAVGELARLQAYVIVYTLCVLLLTFLVLPLLITSLTPFTYREIFRASKTALITAFATGKVIVVLPLLVSEMQELFRKHAENEEQAEGTDHAVETVFPIGYPFPQLGKILGLFFIPFTAWFVGRPLGLADTPALLGAGYLSYFGGPLVATPFMLDMFQLPADMFKLFLASGVYTARIGDLLGAMHMIALTVLTAAALNGMLKLRLNALLRGLALSAGLGLVMIAGINAYLSASFRDAFAKDKVLEEMALSIPEAYRVEAEVVDAKPNPEPLVEGRGVLDRIAQRKRLRVGLVLDKPPFAYRNARGELVGLDVELAHMLATDLGATLEFVPAEYATLVDQMRADHFDLAMGGIASNPERAARMALSHPYMDLTLGIVVRDHLAEQYDSVAEIEAMAEEGLRLGVADPMLQGRIKRSLPGAEIVLIESAEAFFEGRIEGVDAVLATAEVAAAWAMRYPDFSIVNPFSERMALAAVFPIAHDDVPFRKFVDSWIDFSRRVGWMDRLYDRWVLGKVEGPREPRWSVMRNVLGWVD